MGEGGGGGGRRVGGGGGTGSHILKTVYFSDYSQGCTTS